ncbi:MAG: STAS domain-containing protein [SAR324 cluster bacterium]|nr:STAS domain-containing protein [SAR324 cluster bacterium]
MKLTYYINEDVCIMSIEEQLILDQIENFKTETEEMLKKDQPQGIILQLHKITKIDSSGIGAIVTLFKKSEKLRILFCICRPNPHVAERLEITRVNRTIPVYKTEEEAIAYIADNLGRRK